MGETPADLLLTISRSGAPRTLREVPMPGIKSIARRWVTSGAMTAGLWLFSPGVPAPTVPDSPGGLGNPGAGLRDRNPVQAPQGATGLVEVEVHLNAKGEVTDAHMVSGPDELGKGVLSTVLNWRYAMPSPTTARVTVSFSPAPLTTAPAPPAPPRIVAINYR